MREVHFVATSSSDIEKKLQRVEEWWGESPEEMVSGAWRVCMRKDKEKVNNLIEASAELVSAIHYTPFCVPYTLLVIVILFVINKSQ